MGTYDETTVGSYLRAGTEASIVKGHVGVQRGIFRGAGGASVGWEQ